MVSYFWRKEILLFIFGEIEKGPPLAPPPHMHIHLQSMKGIYGGFFLPIFYFFKQKNI